MSARPSFDERKAEVRRRLSLSSVVEKHVRLSGTSASAKRRGKCPFHGSNSACFALFEAGSGDGGAYCFGCQWAGDLFRFLMDINGWDFATALAEAEREAGIAPGGEAVPSRGPVQRERNPASVNRPAPSRVEPIGMGRWIWRQAWPHMDGVRRYFLGRGVPERAITATRLASFRFLPDCPVAPWRLGANPRSELVAPAVVALVELPELVDGAVEWRALGVHLTYLSPDGTSTMRRRKPWVKDDDPDPWLPKRRMLGPVGKGAVRLGPYSPDAPLFVGEGNETVLSAIGLDGDVDDDVMGLATLSLDNLQGGLAKWKGGIWPLHAVKPDPERPCFTVPGHRGPVTGLVDSDMSPLRGRREVGTGAFLGEAVVERKGGPIVNRAITGAERAQICGELVVQGWRSVGAHPVRALRAPMGMDFNDAANAVHAA